MFDTPADPHGDVHEPLNTNTDAADIGTVVFSERWERARPGTCRPRADLPIGGDVIAADTGDWLVIDTVTNDDECGESPHFAEIIDEDGNRQLRINSGNSNSGCADNIDVGAIKRNPPGLRGVDLQEHQQQGAFGSNRRLLARCAPGPAARTSVRA